MLVFIKSAASPVPSPGGGRARIIWYTALQVLQVHNEIMGHATCDSDTTPRHVRDPGSHSRIHIPQRDDRRRL